MPDARDIKITIGDTEIDGRLPLMPSRFAIHNAWLEPAGYRLDGDTWRATAPPDGMTLMAVYAAALAVCWPGLVPESLASAKWSVLEYGERAWDALLGRGYTAEQIAEAGRAVRAAISGSIPTTKEVDEAADPSRAPAGTGTGDSSPSA